MIKLLRFLLLFSFTAFFLFGCTYQYNLIRGESYFLACKDIEITDINGKDVTTFKRGDLFQAYSIGPLHDTMNKYSRSEGCWSDSGEPKCPLEVYYWYGHWGYVNNLTSGCWFSPEKDIPITTSTRNYDKDRIFLYNFDKKFVDIMCSTHPSTFSVGEYTFTDNTMSLSKYILNVIKEKRLFEEETKELARKNRETYEEMQRNEQRKIARRINERQWNLQAELYKYHVERCIRGGELVANPFKYEGQIVAIPLIFIRMLSRSVGVFGIGTSMTGHIKEDVIVSKLPVDLFGHASFDYTLLIVKVKGSTGVMNRIGGEFNAPHLEYVAHVTSAWAWGDLNLKY